ncbi:family 43 glycosylhydrolase [Oerskovia sp. NPDC060338]|uniref:family 43 glycosylhydrolase n=1 Tax=Oerskovia sp. NPDC060338 TaxID=3347100 RepID=UPI00365382FD
MILAGSLGVVGLAAVAVPSSAAPGTAHARSADTASTNVVANPGFEDGVVAPWVIRNGGDLELSDDAYSGASSVLVTERQTTQSGPWQDLTGKVEAGGSYAVSAKVRYDTGPATKQFFVTAFTGGSSYTNIATGTLNRGEWGTLQGTWLLPAGTTPAEAHVFVETPWVPDPAADPAQHLMDFRVDDVSVTLTSPGGGGFDAVGKVPGNTNPLVSHAFGADPYAFAHDGRVYVYTTNDTQEWAPDENNISTPNTYGKINQINVISSADLVNWTDHGPIQVAGPTGAATWANNSWAPAFASKTIAGKEKFFLYFANNAASVGVLEADSPLGPWTDPLGKPLISPETPGAASNGNWLFDPAVVVDDSGQGYLYFGGGEGNPPETPNNPRTTRWIKLGDDMVSTVGTAQVVDAPRMFEASHVFEREGKYYYSYSTNFSSVAPSPGYPANGVIAYMMADSPEGPWTPEQFEGTVLDGMYQEFGVGGNNHQSFFELDGTYYMAYHAQTLNLALVGGDASKVRGFRSTHINEVTFQPDGTMNKVDADYVGVSQIAPLDPYSIIEAETIGYQKGITTALLTSPTSTPALKLTDIDSGDWVALAGVDFGQDGATEFGTTIAPLAGGRVEVRLDSPDTSTSANLVGTIDVPAGDGTWTDLATTIDRTTGVHDVYLTFAGDQEGDLFDVDTWRFGVAGAEVEPVDLAVTARAQCVAGRANLTVRAVNGEDVAVSVALTTPFGTKTFASVAAGKSASQSFNSRAAAVPAGTATVVGTIGTGAGARSTTFDVEYPATTCG